MKPKTVHAYVGEKRVCKDVLKAALDKRVMLTEMKAELSRRFPGVVFKIGLK